MFEHEKLIKILDGILVVLTIVNFLVFIGAVVYFFDIVIESNFDEFVISEIHSALFVSLWFIVGFLLIFLTDSPFILQKKWLFGTITMMAIFLLVGGAVINAELGSKQFKRQLNYDGDDKQKYGELTCNTVNLQGNLLADSYVSCKMLPYEGQKELKIIDANLTTIDVNNRENFTRLSRENFNFSRGGGAYKLHFEFMGLNNLNEEQMISTTTRYDFLTMEEDRERSKQFFAYLVGLITAAFLSIPLMMNSLKEMIKK